LTKQQLTTAKVLVGQSWVNIYKEDASHFSCYTWSGLKPGPARPRKIRPGRP